MPVCLSTSIEGHYSLHGREGPVLDLGDKSRLQVVQSLPLRRECALQRLVFRGLGPRVLLQSALIGLELGSRCAFRDQVPK